MAVASQSATDIDSIKLRLRLEGFDWKELRYSKEVGNMIWIHHPQWGRTWFSEWDTIKRHCDNDWKNTYWPPSW